MIPLVISEIVSAARGKVRSGLSRGSARGVSTDSRNIAAGDLFVAIRGENFDGHAFVAAAARAGAVGAIIAAESAAMVDATLAAAPDARAAAPQFCMIEVDSPVAALGRIAQFHRRQSAAEVIAVAGSNGKTTTKAMVQHILSGSLKGRASPKSFNNAIGVPLTLLSAEHGDEFLVVEIGTNAPGEIAALAQLAEPDIGVITSIGEEHLEGLGDLAGVAREECSLLPHVREKGFAAVNVDGPHVRDYLGRSKLTITKFGTAEDADLRITTARNASGGVEWVVNGRFEYRLPLVGIHNASNATAAIAVARRLGLEHDAIAARLATFAPQPMRGETLQIRGITLINDAYNANPASVAAAIQTLTSHETRGRRILVFGEMRELGEATAAMHRRVAEAIRAAPIDVAILVGRAGEWMESAFATGRPDQKIVSCDSVEAAAAQLDEIAVEGDVVLLKASRAVGLERVIDLLEKSTPQAAA